MSDALDRISKQKEYQSIVLDELERELIIQGNIAKDRSKSEEERLKAAKAYLVALQEQNRVKKASLQLDLEQQGMAFNKQLAVTGYGGADVDAPQVKLALEYVSDPKNKQTLKNLHEVETAFLPWVVVDGKSQSKSSARGMLDNQVRESLGHGGEMGTDFLELVYYISRMKEEGRGMGAEFVKMAGHMEDFDRLIEGSYKDYELMVEAIKETNTPMKDINTAQEGSVAYIKKQLSEAERLRDSYAFMSREWKMQNAEVMELERNLSRIEGIMQRLNEPLTLIEPDAIPKLDTAGKNMEGLSADLQSFKGGLDLPKKEDGMDFPADDARTFGSVMADLWGSSKEVGTIFGDTGKAIQQFAGDSKEGAIAANAMTLAQQGLAFATAIAQAVTMGFPALLASIPAAIAAVSAGVKAIGSFATGGIVGGGSYTGDHLLARVNSGEMILNKAQQSNLFNMVNGGMNYTGSPQMVVLSTRIRGKDIEISGNNYRKIQRKLG
ncbi:MAG: hypothetical protein LUG51_07645 [Tannerellaceae bacterium]|nr:hypothetical protein [Tannerellaceae bacterium]